MNILIVDDEQLIVDDLRHEVKNLYPQANVDGATSARRAIAYAEEKEYDLAMLDIVMPDMDGLELARSLIASSPVINIIFVTGYTQYALDAHDLYCSAFLVKPVGSRKLKKAFENLRKPFIDLPKDFFTDHYSGGAVIGKKLELYRKQRGISRIELAKLMKVSRQTIFRWERGERVPDVITFLKLTRILGVNLEDILSNS